MIHGDEALVRWVAGLTIAFLVKQSSDVGVRHGIVSIIVPLMLKRARHPQRA